MSQPSDRAVDRWRSRSRWLVDTCLDRAERYLSAGKSERSARWLQMAARVAEAGGTGYFAHPRLERAALALAQTLPSIEWHRRGGGPRRWLHVVTAVYDIGGHTAFLRRWINNDRSGDTHIIVLTQSAGAPAALGEVVERAHGRVLPLPGRGLLDRATGVRAASGEADVVVLHHHMWDVVPAIAFGVPGGPPVLTVNHADHTFWVGAAVTDLALNHRPVSAQLNRRYRSVDRNADLPIGLDLPPDPAGARAKVRQSLGIPGDATVFVTVGSEFKYVPIGELDFASTVHRLLDQLPAAYLVAVGPRANRPEWRRHVRACGPRLIAVGPQRDVNAYLAAADIYLEGFPFDSATALLEASLAGLPVVPVPAVAPLPFSAHQGLKAVIPQPASVSQYLDEAVRLAGSPTLRRERAERLSTVVVGTCTGDGWRASLQRVMDSVPSEHSVYAVADAALDEPLDRFLARLFVGTRRLPRLLARLVHEALIAR